MANKITVRTKKGKKTFKNLRAAAKAARMPYITFYMRLRAGLPASTAFKAPVRGYQKVA